MSLACPCPVCGATQAAPVGVGEPLYLCSCGLIHNLRSATPILEESRYLETVYDTPTPVAVNQVEILRRLAAPQTVGRLLDVGCGSGSFLVEAHKHGWDVHGLDISPPAVQRARQRLSGSRQIHCCSLQQMPPGEPFDAITFWDVFDHLEEPHSILDCVVARLKPGGLLILRVRNGWVHLLLRRWESRLRNWLGRPARGNLFGVVHRYGYSVKVLSSLLHQAGLADVRIGPTYVAGRPDGAQAFPIRLGSTARTALARGMDWLARWTRNRVYLSPSILACACAGQVPGTGPGTPVAEFRL